MHKILTFCLVLAAAGCSSENSAPAPAAEQAANTAPAVKAAETWMALVDKKDYDASWDAAAAMLQAVMAKDAWKQQLEKTLSLFGPLQSRSLKKAEYTACLPGAPDGQYVRMEFIAAFEKKLEAVENVTTIKENGTWKVTGYYIK